MEREGKPVVHELITFIIPLCLAAEHFEKRGATSALLLVGQKK
jgi:hypothetical protein